MKSEAGSGAAAGSAADAVGGGPVQRAQLLMRDLKLEDAQHAASVLSSLDISNMADAEAVAAQVWLGCWLLPLQDEENPFLLSAQHCKLSAVELMSYLSSCFAFSCLQMYQAAVGGKAEAVAGALATLVALESGGGNARLLRRLLLTRCEEAFDLSPPPGERNQEHGCACWGGFAVLVASAASLARQAATVPGSCAKSQSEKIPPAAELIPQTKSLLARHPSNGQATWSPLHATRGPCGSCPD